MTIYFQTLDGLVASEVVGFIEELPSRIERPVFLRLELSDITDCCAMDLRAQTRVYERANRNDSRPFYKEVEQ